MDVLSEVLQVIRLSGAIHFCAAFTMRRLMLGSEGQPALRSRQVLRLSNDRSEARFAGLMTTPGRRWCR